MNILVVDDEQDTRRFLDDLLSELGHRVMTAASAPVARGILQRRPVDVVLLDLMMPGTDGFQFARYLSETWGTLDIPVVIISCRRDEDSKSYARIFGCVKYLEKPFDPTELIDTLRDIDRGQVEKEGVGTG
jgi:DNA-binding response OmpR family regulator